MGTAASSARRPILARSTVVLHGWRSERRRLLSDFLPALVFRSDRTQLRHAWQQIGPARSFRTPLRRMRQRRSAQVHKRHTALPESHAASQSAREHNGCKWCSRVYLRGALVHTQRSFAFLARESGLLGNPGTAHCPQHVPTNLVHTRNNAAAPCAN